MKTKKSEFTGAKVLILGLGSHPRGSGVGAAQFFVMHRANVRVSDAKRRTDLAPALKALRGLPITYHLGRHALDDVRWADIIVQNPGVPHTLPAMRLAVQLHKRIETDLTLFLRRSKAKIIGVSGTRGKSTTTSLIYHLVKGSRPNVYLAGNIGVSPLLLKPQPDRHSLVILELSSWMLEGLSRIKYSPPLAVLTNVYPDHLDRYSTMAAYRRAKGLLFKYQQKGSTAIVFNDQTELRRLVSPKSSIKLFSGTTAVRRGVGVRDGWFISFGKKNTRIANIEALRIPGVHNRNNAAAALAVALLHGMSASRARIRLHTFAGLPHRLEFVANKNNVTYINDSHSTTPTSAAAALAAIQSPVIMIMGGVDKKLPWSIFEGLARRKKIQAIILLPGTASHRLARSTQLRRATTIRTAPTVAAATKLAQRLALPGATVLLSPGAASFNQFRNAEERGEAFKKAVQHL